MSQTLAQKKVKLFDTVTLKYGNQTREYVVVKIDTHINCIESAQYQRGVDRGETTLQIMLDVGFHAFPKFSFWERLTQINHVAVA